MSAAMLNVTSLGIPVVRRVRAYFAPVDRVTGIPTLFDPAVSGQFDLDSPPAPWIDLGWVDNFARRSESKIGTVSAGMPVTTQSQVREHVAATVTFRFVTWGKLSMALQAGSQHMNLLAPAGGSAARASGAQAAPAVSLANGSTASFLAMSEADAAKFAVGQLIAVDTDYRGETGFVGAPISAAYVRNAADVKSDADYIRRVTFNLASVAAVGAAGLTLAAPLPGGIPESAMRVQAVVGFVDREGGRFFQEWSGLFVLAGEQGERILYHYPRLQATAGAQEESVGMAAPLERLTLNSAFRALPVTDANDGETALCFRSYLPGTNSTP